MDFLELQSFVEICNCRNITEAAHRLFITQPALSRRIHDLEEELGVTLFLRKSKGIEITEAGQRLYQDAVHLLDEQQSFTAKALRLRGAEAGTLRIAAADSQPVAPLLRSISNMAEQYPDVTLAFESDLSLGIPHLITNHLLDIALCCKAEVDGVHNVPYQMLCENTITVLVGRTHRLWERDKIYLEDLAGESITFCQGVSQNAEASVLMLLRKKCPSITHIFRCRTAKECAFYAASGEFLAICGRIAEEWTNSVSDSVKNIPLADLALDWGAPVAAYNQDNPYALPFIKFLENAFSAY